MIVSNAQNDNTHVLASGASPDEVPPSSTALRTKASSNCGDPALHVNNCKFDTSNNAGFDNPPGEAWVTLLPAADKLNDLQLRPYLHQR